MLSKTKIALTDGRHEPLVSKRRQQDAMIRSVQSKGSECAVEPLAENLGDMRILGNLDEGELTIAHLPGDAGEYLIELRQVFEQGLAAPKHGGRGTQAQLGPIERHRRIDRRLVVDREIRQP